MELTELLNSKYLNLDSFAEKERDNYIKSEPFPNISITNLLLLSYWGLDKL